MKPKLHITAEAQASITLEIAALEDRMEAYSPSSDTWAQLASRRDRLECLIFSEERERDAQRVYRNPERIDAGASNKHRRIF